MKKNSSLPKLRITTELFEKLEKTLKYLNDNDNQLEFSMTQIRRMAYASFCDRVLCEGLEIVLTPNTK